MGIVDRFSEKSLRAHLCRGDAWGRKVPDYMHDSIIAYVRHGRRVDDFTMAVVRGDLFLAVHKADDRNIDLLPAYVFFFFNYTPASCFGSSENVAAWKGLTDGASKD